MDFLLDLLPFAELISAEEGLYKPQGEWMDLDLTTEIGLEVVAVMEARLATEPQLNTGLGKVL